MRTIANPLIFLISSIFCTLCSLYFGYVFLFENENIPPQHEGSLDDTFVSEDITWLKHVLMTIEPESRDNLYSEQYGRYFKVDAHCNLTLQKSSPTFDKLVFIVIDALRVDFVPSIEDEKKNERSKSKGRRMEFMENVLETNGIGLLSLATIPTVTLPRVKALLSGTLPSFVDYILNLSSYSFRDDNFVDNFSSVGKRIVFYGDDTWSRLFSSQNRTFVRSNYTSSLFATDYTVVDLNVTWNVKNELQDLKSWDAMLLHYLGVDHIGHLKGFHSSLFVNKLKEMDSVFQDIFETIQKKSKERYLFVITGDHGMTNSGNHGGNTREETHTAAVFISSDSQSFKNNNDTMKESLHSRTVMQIDIAPTISALFNLPFPIRNQGRVISPILERFQVDDSVHLCNLFRNAFQIQRFIDKNKQDLKDMDYNSKLLKMKSYFLEALNSHSRLLELRSLSASNEKNEERELFKRAKDNYQSFIENVQKEFVRMSNSNSSFFILSVIIAISFSLIFFQLYFEYRTLSHSILYCRPLFTQSLFKSFTQIFQYESHERSNISKNTSSLYQYLFHYKLYESSIGAWIVLLATIGPIIAMGSVKFLELEHFYWDWISRILVGFMILVFFRSSLKWSQSALNQFSNVKEHYQKMLYASLITLIILQIALLWRRPVITEDDVNIWDVFTWLNDPKSKSILGVLFTFSLVSVFVLIPLPTNVNVPRGVFVSSLIFVYLFRTQTGAIRLLKLPFINHIMPRANFLAELVWWHCATIFGLCLFNRLKRHLLRTSTYTKLLGMFEKFPSLYREFMVQYTRLQESKKNDNMKEFTSFLYTFLIFLVVASCLLIEPAQLPVLALNMAMEQLINQWFSIDISLEMGRKASQQDRVCFHRQMFFKLAVYHVMAFSSFYQMGNSNGLSTVNVNACFIGMDSYQIVPCTLFMIISMFGTYLYWILVFYIRMEQSFKQFHNTSYMQDEHRDSDNEKDKIPKLTSNENLSGPEISFQDSRTMNRTLINNYCTFYSAINCSLMLRLSTMTTNALVTLILKEHLFIWSVISPKLLYELIFTLLTVLFHLFIILMFTHDNSFCLYNV